MAAPPYGSGPPWVPGGISPPGVPLSPPSRFQNTTLIPASPYVNGVNYATASTFALSCATGSGIVVMGAAAASAVTSVTDSVGNFYQLLYSFSDGSQFDFVAVCAKSISPNPKITINGGGVISAAAFEIVGANPDWFVDGCSNSIAGTNVRTTGRNGLILGLYSSNSAKTAPAGYRTISVTVPGMGRTALGWGYTTSPLPTEFTAFGGWSAAASAAITISIRAAGQYPNHFTPVGLFPEFPPGLGIVPPGTRSIIPIFPETVPPPPVTSPAQYYGEDAELLDQDDDEQVDPASDYQIASVVPTSTQYYGEDAELLDQDDDDQVITDTDLAQAGDAPIEDGWDWWSQEDDDYAISEDYLPLGIAQYYGEDAELLDQDDDDQIVLYNDPTDGILQYYGEDAELLDQDDDEQPVLENTLSLQGDCVIEDGWDWFAQEDDDYLVVDDYALIENLSPVEDPWDHWSTEDDDQVDVVEFTLISVPLTALQYYGEDAETADLDQDDDEWTFRDESNVQNPSLAQVFDDGWDFWSQDEDDYAVSEDYSPDGVLQYFGDQAELLDQEDDEQPPVEYEQPPVPPQSPEDAYDHFVTDDDEQWTQDESQSFIFVNALLNLEDPYDHWLTDDDEYYVDDDFQFSPFIIVTMTGLAFSSGFSFGVMVAPNPIGPITYDPRFFNGSNAWLGFRTASGGGVW